MEGSPDIQPSLMAKGEEKDDLARQDERPKPSLDLSFGDTPMEFQRVNLLGSRLQQAAIYSLVLSLNTVTYLDLRGNNLDATFGWRLIKAMKKRYLQLEFCNGVNTRAIRDNTVEHLNLANFTGHSGLYGIEVVGAIFLAHFLRLNSSLRTLSFRRNQVEKDGAKAIAQSMIGNANCVIRSVNGMGVRKKERTGVDLRKFRQNDVPEVNLENAGLDDDDVVFLEEWLLRHDCTVDLNLSRNNFCGEGVRKLHRYILNSKTLVKLRLDGVPLDLEGVSLMAKALSQNVVLEQASFSTRACLGIQKEKQVVMHSLAVALAKHPKISTFGKSPLKVSAIKDDQMAELNVDRIFASPIKSEIALYFWLLAVICPNSKTDFKFGGAKGTFSNEFPAVTAYPVSFCPALNNCLHECRNILTKVQLAIPPGMDGLAVQIMRHLRTSKSLIDLKLPGYAATTISEVPPDWGTDGRLPAWIKEKLGLQRRHWQVLQSFLAEIPTLQIFGNVKLKNYDADSAERALLLLLECCPGVVCQLDSNEDAENPGIVLSLTCGRDDLRLPFVFDCFRLVDKLVYDVELHFLDTKSSRIAATQLELATYLKENDNNRNIPPFVHNLRLRSQNTAKELVECAKLLPNVKEFGLERVETVLDTLVDIFRDADSKQEISRIRIDRKWLQSRRIPKLFSEGERDSLMKLQQGISSAGLANFTVLTSALGQVTKDSLVSMSITQFGATLAGLQVDGWAKCDTYAPQVYVPCVTNPKEYYYPEASGGKWDHGQFYPDDLGGHTPLAFELPTLDTGLQLRQVSLCMLGLKKLVQGLRCDEWPTTSRAVWAQSAKCKYRPGQFLNDDVVSGGFETLAEVPFDAATENLDEIEQFHWNPQVKLGTNAVLQTAEAASASFTTDFLRTCLESLLTSPTITSLDLRGNGLNKQDCLFIIGLLEKNTTLLTLNQIPVVVDEAQKMTELVFDHHGIPIPKMAANDDEEEENQNGENNVYCSTAFGAQYVNLDEGDGYLFASLVTSTNFPELASIQIKEHSVSDATLAYICDALLALPNLDNLDFIDMKLSNRGANLLLSAVSEISTRLRTVNGIPLARLIEEKKGQSTGGEVKGAILAGDIVWNDFSLGLLSRLKLWPHVVWPEPSTQPLKLEGHTITDVGVRGLCGLLKCFRPADGLPPSSSLPMLRDLDLSRNPSLTDAAVAVLCKQLSVENACPTLEKLTVRYCPKLRARTAFELYQLLRAKFALNSAGEVDADTGVAAAGLKSLKVLNGIDIEALTTATAAGKPLPPAVIRVDVDQAVGNTVLSECDSHFFAHVLHTFPGIPHCHVHLLVTHAMEIPEEAENFAEMCSNRRYDVSRSPSSNSAPFVPPIIVRSKLERELKEIVRFYRACPVSMKVQLSVIPKIPVEHGMHIQDDGTIFLMQNEVEMEQITKSVTKQVHVNSSGPAGIFGHLVEKLVKKKARRDSAASQAEGGGSASAALTNLPAKPMYVNNINSQRMHDCFRTLYGNDEVHLFHSDIYSDANPKHRICFPHVDPLVLGECVSSVSSLDIQHLFLSHSPLSWDLGGAEKLDLASLTHLNMAYNNLGDAGVVDLFTSLVKCGSTLVHISVQANQMSDISAVCIAHSIQSLPRLSSLNLSENNITESGSMALAESIGGSDLHNAEVETSLLNVLAVDLGGNRVRELGALRFAEMVAMHPTIQFLCLSSNEIAYRSDEAFSALVYAAAASASLAVLDLRGNFEDEKKVPAAIVKRLLAEPLGDFDPAEMEDGVFIRRK